jgi:RHS repeat-associated protein
MKRFCTAYVRVVVSDGKVVAQINGESLEIRANVLSYNNYYPFGMEMPNGSFASEGYRFGFNGKERDDDFGGKYDYGMKIYDDKSCRFLSVDPIARSYPELTPPLLVFKKCL